jgi:hypothetical protein
MPPSLSSWRFRASEHAGTQSLKTVYYRLRALSGHHASLKLEIDAVQLVFTQTNQYVTLLVEERIPY